MGIRRRESFCKPSAGDETAFGMAGRFVRRDACVARHGPVVNRGENGRGMPLPYKNAIIQND